MNYSELQTCGFVVMSQRLFFLIFCVVFKTEFHSIAQAGLKVTAILLLQLLSTEITGMSPHTQVTCIFKVDNGLS